MSSIERGVFSPDVNAQKEAVAGFLTRSIANGEHDPAPVRARFDQVRGIEELVTSAAHFPPEEIVHDPAELVPDAVAAIKEAVIVAKLIEYRRYQDEAA